MARKHQSDDSSEAVSLMEPLLVSESSRHRAAISDLALDLAAKSAGFRRSLPGGVRTALATFVRSMNCYYSNLIEGHDTHPIDIERSLQGDYSVEPEKRNLQLEAQAHIAVQTWIDEGGVRSVAMTIDGIRDIHRRFCRELPPELLVVEDPETKQQITVVPGELRDHDVKVGRHIPVSPGAVPRFLEHFQTGYSDLGKVDTIVAAATAHHRLLWIHPFADGNGRVARLMSHAVLEEALETGGVWSIARGLARSSVDYKSMLMACDAPRRNDLDGRGHLSEEALAEFVEFFLASCIDQVEFMESLVQPQRLRDRVLIWAEEEIRADTLAPGSGKVLEAILFRGELPRGDISELLNVSDRQARRVTSILLKRDVLISESSRAPLRLHFPATLASRWMPGLFPDQPR